MKNFRGTILFAAVVLAIGGFAVWEYQKSQKEEEEKVSRDHILRGLTPEDVVEVSYKSAQNQYELKKTDGMWRQMTPIADAGDADAILAQVRNVATQTVEVQDTDGAPINWAQYGLTEPLGVFLFKTAQGQEYKIEVGTVRTYDNGYYLKKNGESELIVGSSSWESYLNKTALDFRSKKIEMPAAQVDTLTYLTTDKKKKSDMQLVRKDGTWSFSAAPGMKVASQEVDAFIAQLRDLRGDTIATEKAATKSLATYGLDRPLVRVTLGPSKANEQQQAVNVIFGLNKNDEAFFTSDRNIAIYKITKARLEEFLKSTLDFRDRNYPFEFSTDAATQLTLLDAQGKEKAAYVKAQDKWNHKQNSAIPIKQEELKSVLSSLSSLKAEDFLPKANWGAGVGGTYQVQGADGKEIYRLQYGAIKKSRNDVESYVVKTNLQNSDEWLLVSKSSLDEIINKKLEDEVKSDAAPAVSTPPNSTEKKGP